MNILIFTLEFPPMLGGAGTYCYELAQGLAMIDGNKVTVLTTDREEDKGFKNPNIEVVRIKWIPLLWFVYMPFFLKRFLKRNHFDVIYFGNLGSLIVGSRLKYIKYPYYCTMHGSERYTLLKEKMSCKYRILTSDRAIKNFLGSALGIICVSDDLLNDINSITDKRYNSNKISLGISEVFFKNNVFLKSKNADIYNIICVGRFVKGKGQDEVIKIFSKIKNIDNYSLTMIGDGPTLEYCKNLAYELKIFERVNFLGAIKREQIIAEYSKSHLFILLSKLKETFGLVYVEAMASSLPIIGYDNGAVRDLINDGKNGILLSVDVEDSKVIDAIEYCCRNYVELGSNSYKTALDYTNHKMAVNHLKLFKKDYENKR